MIDKEAKIRRDNYLIANVTALTQKVNQELHRIEKEAYDCSLRGNLEKEAVILDAGLGAGIGALAGKKGKKGQAAGYGAVKGITTGLGSGIGSLLGVIAGGAAGTTLGAAIALAAGNKLNNPDALPLLIAGGYGGAALGGLAGSLGGAYTGWKMGTPYAESAAGSKWEDLV